LSLFNVKTEFIHLVAISSLHQPLNGFITI